MDTEIIAEIRSLEARRCRALVARDLDALADLVADDLVHIHTSGRADNRAAYLEGVKSALEFLRVERGDLQVRVYGTIAVMTGALNQTIRVKPSGKEFDMKAVATQVWTKTGTHWRQVSFHACLKS